MYLEMAWARLYVFSDGLDAVPGGHACAGRWEGCYLVHVLTASVDSD